MPQPDGLNPIPFFMSGGSIGVLLVHGFTGAPPEMRPLGDYLAARGHTVSGVLLAGHGTTPHDLAVCRWQDWYASVETAFEELRVSCESVFVAGLSLGGLLTAHLGAQRDGRVAGLILMAPALIAADKRIRWVPLLKHFKRFVPAGATSPFSVRFASRPLPVITTTPFSKSPLNCSESFALSSMAMLTTCPSLSGASRQNTTGPR